VGVNGREEKKLRARKNGESEKNKTKQKNQNNNYGQNNKTNNKSTQDHNFFFFFFFLFSPCDRHAGHRSSPCLRRQFPRASWNAESLRSMMSKGRRLSLSRDTVAFGAGDPAAAAVDFDADDGSTDPPPLPAEEREDPR
jgi:hypothetical protein